jgi:exodeoxyribonuclease V beta subunit
LLPSLLAQVPAGADVGTFVHGVLERVDFAEDELRPALRRAVEADLARYPGPQSDSEMLVVGLEAAITAPLGRLVGGARLRDVARADRLDELRFELPLAGGDQPAGEVLTADLASLFARYVDPGQPLAAYGAALASPHLAPTLRGYLTGSLDLVFRRHGRYFVADYKTNWLGSGAETLSAWDYRPSALEAEMLRAHYPLQALFYLVALHRYLRWRIPGYRASTHLGGALFLFVRGMVGPASPTFEGGVPCGVFPWRPPAALVTELSDLLAGSPTGPAREAGTGAV